MKLIIAGGRNITQMPTLVKAIAASGYGRHYKRSIEVVCGLARGADALGKDLAEQHGLKLHCFPADWDTHGKKAGMLRNEQMQVAADGLLAIWDGRSRGTVDMIARMRKAKKEVYVFMVDPDTLLPLAEQAKPLYLE